MKHGKINLKKLIIISFKTTNHYVSYTCVLFKSNLGYRNNVIMFMKSCVDQRKIAYLLAVCMNTRDFQTCVFYTL